MIKKALEEYIVKHFGGQHLEFQLVKVFGGKMMILGLLNSFSGHLLLLVSFRWNWSGGWFLTSEEVSVVVGSDVRPDSSGSVGVELFLDSWNEWIVLQSEHLL